MLDIYEELENVVVALEQNKIPYALCGGLAVGVYVEPRATKDIDLIVLTEDIERAKTILQSCGFQFFSSPMFFANSQVELHKLTKIEPGGKDYLFLDLLINKSSIASKIWESRQRLFFRDLPVWVISREWLVWMKKLRNSYLDLSDIEKLENLDKTF